MSAFTWFATAGLVATAYLFRRHFVFVKPPASTLASREQLLEWIAASANKDDGTGADVDITLLEDTAEAHEEELSANARAFADYLMYTWYFRAAPLLTQQDQSDVVRAFSGLCQSIASSSGGMVLCARDRKTGRILASARVAKHNCHSSPSAWHMVKLMFGLVNGRVKLPWSAVFRRSSALLFKRFGSSGDALDAARIAVTKDTAAFPGPEYLHLVQIAADPTAQSKGCGTKILAALGRIADELKLPIYLETDTLRLREYYERNGFVVKQEYRIEDDVEPFEINFGMVRVPK